MLTPPSTRSTWPPSTPSAYAKRLADRSRMTNEASSDTFYDSRTKPHKGIGFPSCSQELACIQPNVADPQGYYREIGVDPWARPEVIRRAVRKLLIELHPDTGSGDIERLNRVKNIASVLLDDMAREKYNRTPPGHRVMDAVYASELSKIDDLDGLTEEEVREVLQPQAANPYHGKVRRFDYLAVGHQGTDTLTAQMWYHHLTTTAPRAGYRSVIKVMLWSEELPAWDPQTHLLMIPRRWEPSSFAAYALFTKVIGSSVFDRSRFDAGMV
jgi:hypothetical protein